MDMSRFKLLYLFILFFNHLTFAGKTVVLIEDRSFNITEICGNKKNAKLVVEAREGHDKKIYYIGNYSCEFISEEWKSDFLLPTSFLRP